VPYTFDGSGTLTGTVAIHVDDNDHEQTRKTSSNVHVQFLGENALFSSIEFEFACRGYRISLLKKKICTGKYQAEQDQHESIEPVSHPSIEQHRRLSLSTSLVA
jgi:hypothetical protein